MSALRELADTRRWVVKFGSSLVSDEHCGLAHDAIREWMRQLAQIRADRQIVIVSSGAVAEGMNRLGWTERPASLHELQAAAAVGQMGLVRAYESALAEHECHSAQVLLTHEGLQDRARYLNVRTTLRSLLELEVVPVVNENDTVSTQELQLGDNDNLAAMVANLIEADLLIILTDQKGLYDQDPRKDANARLIEQAQVEDTELDVFAKEGRGRLGRGGMRTKIEAARVAARGGARCLIAHGAQPEVLMKVAQGTVEGTLLLPSQEVLSARKQWIAGPLKSNGRVHIDAGAEKALRAGKSLLPIGVTQIEGSFRPGDVVAVLTEQHQEIARGIVNYADEDARRIQGHRSRELEDILGVIGEPELIHRDNLCPLWGETPA